MTHAVTERPLSLVWADMVAHAKRCEATTLTSLFAADPARASSFSVQFEDMLVDFSKEKLDTEALESLLALARARNVEERRDAMFAGEHVNTTEHRPALHMALRDGVAGDLTVDGETIPDLVRETRESFLRFAEAVRAGEIASASGAPFKAVVNIGIGGSDLGSVMVTGALAEYADGPDLYFVANAHAADIQSVLARLDPATTLIIIASKSFTTQETMTNAEKARMWLIEALGAEGAGQHLAALSTNLAATSAFGVDPARVFGFWDWVGGRYSIWSAIGLPLAIALGRTQFEAFLAGARAMDEHFHTAPLGENLPIMMALLAIWRRNGLGYTSTALIPYDQRLRRFTAFVQQLDMESNGKSVGFDGTLVPHKTALPIWGEPGTNAQHSFFQMLHQGTDAVPVDFIMAANAGPFDQDQHHLLLANCLAQSSALAFGVTETAIAEAMRRDGADEAAIAELAPHRACPGDRPSTTIIYETLSPYSLGRLVALFEHKVFVQGLLWGVNSFDQWGVELGKKIAQQILPMLETEAETDKQDASTRHLIDYIRKYR